MRTVLGFYYGRFPSQTATEPVATTQLPFPCPTTPAATDGQTGTGDGGGLSTIDKISVGVGLGVGVSGLVATVWGGLVTRKMRKRKKAKRAAALRDNTAANSKQGTGTAEGEEAQRTADGVLPTGQPMAERISTNRSN
jgi:hypothetical protein